jgi:hypothetical protein
MDKLVQSLGVTTLSKSQVSVMAEKLDAHVEEFRTWEGNAVDWLRAPPLQMRVELAAAPGHSTRSS